MTYYSECILLALLVISGLVGIIGSASLDMFEQSLPGPGFFPAVLGAGLIALVVLESKALFHVKEKSEIDGDKVKKIVVFFAALTGTILIVAPLIGLLPSLGIFYVASLIVWNKYSYINAFINASLLVAIIYMVFSVWLGVSMPWGIF